MVFGRRVRRSMNLLAHAEESGGGATHIGVVCLRKHAEDITIQRSVILIKRRLTPSTWVESPLRSTQHVNRHRMLNRMCLPFGNGGIETWNSQRRVTWWRTEALHADEPWRWRQGRY